MGREGQKSGPPHPLRPPPFFSKCGWELHRILTFGAASTARMLGLRSYCDQQAKPVTNKQSAAPQRVRHEARTQEAQRYGVLRERGTSDQWPAAGSGSTTQRRYADRPASRKRPLMLGCFANICPSRGGKGRGRSRTYSFLDAVRISVAAELTRLGISAVFAGRAVENISDRAIIPIAGRRTALVLASSRGQHDRDDKNGLPALVCSFQSMADVDFVLSRMTAGGAPP